MKKENFISLVMGTVGGLLFALGMCMALLPQWDAFLPGVICGVIGAAVLLVMVTAVVVTVERVMALVTGRDC